MNGTGKWQHGQPAWDETDKEYKGGIVILGFCFLISIPKTTFISPHWHVPQIQSSLTDTHIFGFFL